MFRIAICDDSMIQQGMVRELLQTYGEKNNKELSVDVYNNATALLSYVEQNGGYDMYVLDIVMEGVKGNELAGILRGRGDNGFILFLTATGAFSNQIEKYAPASYMLKPIDMAKVDEILGSLI